MTTIQSRRGTLFQWNAANPVLASGEVGFETDTRKYKIGDGVSVWSALEYIIDQDDVMDSVTILLEAQVPPLVVEALASTPSVASAAAAAVSTALSGASILRGAYQMDDSIGYILAFTDSTDRYAMVIGLDGVVTILKPSFPKGTISLDTLEQGYFSTTKIPGYKFVVTDSNDRIAFAIDDAGHPVGNISPGDGTVTVAKLASDVLVRLPNGSAKRDLVGLGRKLQTRDPAGHIRPYTSTTDIACWGDSLTEGWPQQTGDFTDPSQAYPGVLDTLLTSATVYNGGKAGQQADEIAIRQGGYTLTVSVSGGSIPASGGVTVVEDQIVAWRTDLVWNDTPWGTSNGVSGVLAGVPGRISRSGSVLTFTRTASGSAVAVSGSVPFTVDNGELYKNCTSILFAGRNDIGRTSPAGTVVNRVLSAYIAMVESFPARHPRFLVVGVIPATSETAGSTNHNDVLAINAGLADLYPDNMAVDTAGRNLHRYLVQQVIYDLGLTPTTTDLAKMAADTLPPQIMATAGTDTVHYSVATAAKIAAWMRDRLVGKGWAV